MVDLTVALSNPVGKYNECWAFKGNENQENELKTFLMRTVCIDGSRHLTISIYKLKIFQIFRPAGCEFPFVKLIEWHKRNTLNYLRIRNI